MPASAEAQPEHLTHGFLAFSRSQNLENDVLTVKDAKGVARGLLAMSPAGPPASHLRDPKLGY